MDEKRYALITGATGGIGLELARLFAADGHPVLLAGRDPVRLEERRRELSAQYGVPVETVCRDLTGEDAATRLFEETRARRLSVDVLVNNAGFGDFTRFLDADWKRQRDMVTVNVAVPMRLIQLYGGAMREQGGGRILNVASVAAMGPGPYMATYYASKAFLLSFSEAMTEELRECGITVTALCPGPTATGFEHAAKLESGNLFKTVKVEPAAKVAKRGYRALMKGKPVQYCGPTVGFMTLGARLLPRAAARRFARRVNGRPAAK